MTREQEDALKLDNQLCFPLYAAARKITGLYTPYLKPLGLTYTQYIVFMVLWEQDGLPVGEIGRRLHLDNGTLTPLLKKMETAGHVLRRRETQDERVVCVFLTEQGRALKEQCAGIPFAVAGCVGISPEEGMALQGLLRRILE